MNRSDAATLATRIAARFPTARIGKPTLEEWAGELAKLDLERGDKVLEWLSTNLETAPTFKQIRLAMARVIQPKPAPDAWKDHDLKGQDSACEFCGDPVKNGPDAASRYDVEFGRWHNAHLSCADQQPGTRAN